MMKFPSTWNEEDLFTIEEDLLTFEISDEALETTGEIEMAGSYTLGACTGLSVCPG